MKILRIILINFFVLFFFLYIFELYLNLSNDQLFKKTRLHFLNVDQNKNNSKVFLNFGSYKIIDNKNLKILPLSGYDNSKILLCLDEKNKPIYYTSDKNGFRNLNFKKKNFDFLLIGDSYVQGMCVDNKNNFTGQLEKINFKSLGLGIGGNGPLIELATFMEYENEYNYKSSILFITPGNDFYDLSNEINNKILNQYLNNKNFNQNLNSSHNRNLKKEILDNFFGNKTSRILNDFFSVYHFNLKKTGNLIEKIFENEFHNMEYKYLLNKEIDEYYIKIVDKFLNIHNEKNKNFYIVFNSVPPNILFPSSHEEKKFNKIIFEKIAKIKALLNKRKVIFFDYNVYLKQNYNKKNINKIFKKINGNWDHYTNKGNEKIIQESMKKFNYLN